MSRPGKLPNLLTASILVVSVLFLSSDPGAAASATGFVRSTHRRRVAEIHRHLAQVNKPAVKSIQSVDGDIIDCVRRTQQPAFDHPVLRNHSLEVAPLQISTCMYSRNLITTDSPFALKKSTVMSSNDKTSIKQVQSTVEQSTMLSQSPEMTIAPAPPGTQSTDVTRNESFPSSIPAQLWHQSGHCPAGTVPIRRTSMNDVLRAGSMKHYMTKKTHRVDSTKESVQQQAQASQEDNGHDHAIGFMRDGLFFGAQASLNVWSPRIQMPSEFSLSQIWVLAGAFNNDLNSIEAGWQVSPQLYGDGNPRLFIYWTADSYQGTGCYNLLCSGFIQTSNAVAIGATIMPLSSTGGPQYEIRILIWKDPRKGNWWMQFGDDHLVGYWPASLFTHLSVSASMLEWGGEVVNSHPGGHHTTTAMGSGQFPEKGFAQASYVRNIKYVDGKNVLQTPVGLRTLAEHPNCYNIRTGVSRDWGAYFYYGGPGFNANCP